jgi:hypothetical protein
MPLDHAVSHRDGITHVVIVRSALSMFLVALVDLIWAIAELFPFRHNGVWYGLFGHRELHRFYKSHGLMNGG